MSDSVAKAEIEDVLSSVKRLVSEEGLSESFESLQSAKRKPGRLVLTEALRVTGPAIIDEDDELLILSQDELDASSASEPSELGSLDSEAGQPMLLRPSDIVKDEVQAADPSLADKTQTPQPENAQMRGAGDNPVCEDLADSLSAKIEALEAAIAQTEDQWEPDGESDDAYSGTRIRPMMWTRPEASAKDPENAGSEKDKHVDADGAGEPADEVSTPDERVMFSRRRFEPSGDTPDTSNNNAGSDEGKGALDENALRALVSEVVREELQGVLGERITRNVRKLVRREILRALAAKELE